MRSPMRTITTATAAVLLAGLIFGCGTLRTAPKSDPQGGVGGSNARRAPAPEGLIGGVLQLVDQTTEMVVQTVDLTGTVGAVLNNGRWKVTVPSGAVSGSASVSLSVADPLSPVCDLGILPSTKNHFDVPVTLTVACPGVSDLQLRNWTIFWYDPANKMWVPVPGAVVDLKTRTISAPLQHFSTYGVGGKAGW
jgi:hypothetical protein